MKKLNLQESWPESWQLSYVYDLLEVYGDKSNIAYTFAYKNRCKHILELIQLVSQPEASVLDIAAAQGNFSLKLAELGYQVVWNDFRGELANYVREKWEHGSIQYVPGNILTLGFERSFDVILAAEVIEHVAHPDKFLRHIAGMLKPGGHIVLSTPNGEYFRNTLPKFSDCKNPSQFEAIQFKPNSDGHIFLLHLEELENIAKQAGLTVVELRLITNPLTIGHLKFSKVLKYIPDNVVLGIEKISQNLPLLFKRKLCVCTIALLTKL